MRFVPKDANNEPPGLRKRADAELARYKKARKKVPPGKFKFSVYKSDAVKTALDALFHKKCAYCESCYSHVHPVDIEHYRPKADIESAPSHGGYFWLAADWFNLLPSCIDCNRRREQKLPRPDIDVQAILSPAGEFNRSASLQSGKSTLFPLLDEATRAQNEGGDLAAELRLLIDPSRDDPGLHLSYFASGANLTSLIYARSVHDAGAPALPAAAPVAEVVNAAARAGVSAMGAVSIAVYGLNRLDLVQARSKAIRDAEFLIVLATDVAELVVEISERISEKMGRVRGTNSVEQAHIIRDVRIDRRIRSRLRQLETEIRSKIAEAVADAAPYSEAVKAWLRLRAASPAA